MSQFSTLDDFWAALRQADKFKLQVTGAGSPAEMDAAYASLVRQLKDIEGRWEEWNTDLILEFNKSYRMSGGSGAIPKSFYQKAYRTRQKANKGWQRANTGLRTWANDYLSDQKIFKARQVFNKQIYAARQRQDMVTMRKLKAELDKLPKVKGAESVPTVTWNRRNRKSGTITRVHISAYDYMTMATNAAYGTQRNLGVAAAAAKKSGYVIVHDGNHCGKSGHNNGPTVNGQIWPVQDAFEFPLSHPNCVRTFTVSDGPPGSRKAREQLKAMREVQRTTAMQTLEGIAKAAAVTGLVMSFLGEAVQNPFVRRFMRSIIADQAATMSPQVQQFMNRLFTYGKNEEEAFKTWGKRLDISSQEGFNSYVAQTIDDDFASGKFVHAAMTDTFRLSPVQSQVLGIQQQVSKAQLLDRLDDYADWMLHRDSLTQTVAQRLRTARNVVLTNDEVWGQAAIKFHMRQPYGLRLRRNWYETVKKLKETYDASPEKANRDLIRLVAASIDPTPWMRINLAPGWRFTMGMTSQGRQDLAIKLYDKFTLGQRHLSDAELRWVETLGMDVSKFNRSLRLTPREIAEAFMPRITYMPGGNFSASIALKNGKVLPLIRLYPPGALGRITSLESRLRLGAVEDFIKTLENKDLPMADRWLAAFKHVAAEDVITSINLFRQSPLQLALHFTGPFPDSFAIRALPDSDLLQYSYRFSLPDFHKRTELEALIRQRLLNGEELKAIIDDLAATRVTARMPEGLTLRQQQRWRTVNKEALAKIANKEAAQVIAKDLEAWEQGIVVLPRLGGGLGVESISLSQGQAVMTLKLLNESLLKISKFTRLEYDALLEWWEEWRPVYERAKLYLSVRQLTRLRSFEDAREIAERLLRSKYSTLDEIPEDVITAKMASLRATPDITNRIPRVILKNDRVMHDLARVEAFFQDQLGLPAPPWAVHAFADEGVLVTVPTSSFFNPEYMDLIPPGVKPGIHIGPYNLMDWGHKNWMKSMRRSVRLNWWPAESATSYSVMAHEYVHWYALEYMGPQEWARMGKAGIRSISWPQFTSDLTAARLRRYPPEAITDFFDKIHAMPGNRRRLARALSNYGTVNFDEMIANALQEYLGSPRPRAFARAVGEEFFKIIDEQVEHHAPIPGHLKGEPRLIQVFRPKYKWEGKPSHEIYKIYQDLEQRWVQPIKDYMQSLAAEKFDRKITWWWREDVPGLEDVEYDIKLNDHPTMLDAVFRGLERVRQKFPNMGLPRIGVWPASDPSMLSAFAGRNTSDGIVYINEHLLNHLDTGQEFMTAGGKVGWSNNMEGLQDTIVHEIGHHIYYLLDEQQFLKALGYLKDSTLLAPRSREMLGRIIENWDASVVKKPWPYTRDAWLGSLNDIVTNDGSIPVTLKSKYAASNFSEYFAELFLGGMNGKSPEMEGFVSMLQKTL